MDDFQNLRKQLNAAVEDVIEAGVRHAQAQESIKAAEVAKMGGLQLCLLSPLADLHEKEWSIQYSNGEHDDPESLDLLLYACYAEGQYENATVINTRSMDNYCTTFQRLIRDRPDLQEIVQQLQPLREAAEEAKRQGEESAAKLRHAELVYVVRRMMIRMAERSGERWMRKLENGSLQSETMSQRDLDEAMHFLKLQGYEEFCRADGGVVMTARNIVDKWREAYVTLLLLGPVGNLQSGTTEAATFEAGKEICWSYSGPGVQPAFTAEQWLASVQSGKRRGVERVHHVSNHNVSISIDSLRSVVASVETELGIAQQLGIKRTLRGPLGERIVADCERKNLFKNVVAAKIEGVLGKWLADREAGCLPPLQLPPQPPMTNAGASGRQQEPAAFPALQAAAAHRAASAAAAGPSSRSAGGAPPLAAAERSANGPVLAGSPKANGSLQSAAQQAPGASWDDAVHDMDHRGSMASPDEQGQASGARATPDTVMPEGHSIGAAQQRSDAPRGKAARDKVTSVSSSLGNGLHEPGAPRDDTLPDMASSGAQRLGSAQQKDGASWDDAARDMELQGSAKLQGRTNGFTPAAGEDGQESRKRPRSQDHWDAGAEQPTSHLQNGGCNGWVNNAEVFLGEVLGSAEAPEQEQKSPKRARNGEMHMPNQAPSPQRHTGCSSAADEPRTELQNGKAAPGDRARSPAEEPVSPTAQQPPEHDMRRDIPPETPAPAPMAAPAASPAAAVSTAAALIAAPGAAESAAKAPGSAEGLHKKQAGLVNGQLPGAAAAKSAAPMQAANGAPTLQRSKSGKRELISFKPSPPPARKSAFERLSRPGSKQPAFSPPQQRNGSNARSGSNAVRLSAVFSVPDTTVHNPAEQNGGTRAVHPSAGADDNALRAVPGAPAPERATTDQAAPTQVSKPARLAVSEDAQEWRAFAPAAEPVGSPDSIPPANGKQATSADKAATEERLPSKGQPATARAVAPDGSGTSLNGKQLHSTEKGEKASKVQGAAIADPPQHDSDPPNGPDRSAAAASAQGAGGIDLAPTGPGANCAALPEAPSAAKAVAAASAGACVEDRSPAQPGAASPAQQIAPNEPSNGQAGVLTSAPAAAAADTAVSGGAPLVLEAVWCPEPSDAAPEPTQSSAEAQPHSWALQPQSSVQAAAEVPSSYAPGPKDSSGGLEETGQEQLESSGAADMDVEPAPIVHAEGGGSEGRDASPDETALSAQSQEARAGGAQALMMDAAEGGDAENCVCIGEIDGKPWVVKDYTLEEWKLTFLELKELAIAAGLTHCIIPEGEPVPSTAPCDISDSESSSGDDDYDADEYADVDDADDGADRATARVSGGLRELLGLACDVERQPMHKVRKSTQPPPVPAPPKHARKEKQKHVSLKAKFLKPQTKAAAVQKVKGASKAGKRSGKTVRSNSSSIPAETGDSASLQFEDVCSRALPVEAVSRKSALAAQARQAAMRVAAQPAAAVEGRAGRVHARQLARSVVTQDLATWQKLQGRADELRLGRSGVHAWGLFAHKPIPANEFVIEYVGELIRRTVNDVRERVDADSDYRFRVDADWVVDATRRGGKARFINHCCDPNCVTKTVSVGGQLHIMICSKRAIAEGEELSYDYKFQPTPGEAPIPCTCGARNCRKRLN